MGSGGSKNEKKNKDSIKIKQNEVIIDPNSFYSLDQSITKAAKSLCKIITPNQLGSGFLIQIFKGNEKFYCLMTNEHVIKKEMVEQKLEIEIYYDSQFE